MYTLRHYQEEAVRRGVEHLLSGSSHRPVIVAPTASGKSLMIAYMVKQLTGNVLVLQPSQELLKQNYEKYDNAIKAHPELERASIYSASVGIKERGRVTFAMIGSIRTKPELFSDVKYIIIDECHFVPPDKSSMYMQFIAALPWASVVGLTATPYRLKSYTDLDGTQYSKINLLPREVPKFFNKFLYVIQPRQMLDEGFICPINYIEMKWDGSFLEFNSTGAEYSENSVREAIERNNVIGKIPGILDQAFKRGRKACLVFVRSVEEARHLAEITPFSAYVCALTPKPERAQIIKNFKAGNIKTLFNVAVLTTGFDFPGLDTIIICRPTMSLALFVQMIGRGIRIAEGKTYCSVLDMCGNLQRFGKIEDLHVEEDHLFGWVLRNDKQVLSGRRLDELV